jgi:GT2 family glycosyltransferase
MKPLVKIIILNWNGWEDTLECLESLYQINYPNYDIIIVDNDSEDESITKIKEYCEGKIKVKSPFYTYNPNKKPIDIIEYSETDYDYINKVELLNNDSNTKLILLKNNKNYGFAEGNNLGIKIALKSEPDYILLLNNDTVVDEDFLDKLVDVSENNDKIGVVGPIIYYYDFDGKTNVPANIGGIVDLKRYPGYYDLVDINADTETDAIIDCDWVSGAAMMIKVRDVPIKYLNNQLFFGNEDIDLCINLKNMGYKIVNIHRSVIWHKEGVSRKKRSSAIFKKVMLEIEVNLKFLKMHNNHYYTYLPIYLLQIFILYVKVMIGKI